MNRWHRSGGNSYLRPAGRRAPPPAADRRWRGHTRPDDGRLRRTCSDLRFFVGLPGFEPGTFGPPDQRANQAAPQPVDPERAGRRCYRAATADSPSNRFLARSTAHRAVQRAKNVSSEAADEPLDALEGAVTEVDGDRARPAASGATGSAGGPRRRPARGRRAGRGRARADPGRPPVLGPSGVDRHDRTSGTFRRRARSTARGTGHTSRTRARAHSSTAAAGTGLGRRRSSARHPGRCPSGAGTGYSTRRTGSPSMVADQVVVSDTFVCDGKLKFTRTQQPFGVAVVARVAVGDRHLVLHPLAVEAARRAHVVAPCSPTRWP